MLVNSYLLFFLINRFLKITAKFFGHSYIFMLVLYRLV